MAITYPLALASFYDALNAWPIKFDLVTYQSLTGLANGEIIAAQRATPKWGGDIVFKRQHNRASVGKEALIASLKGSVGSFKAYDMRRAYPLNDPTGSILGASAVKIKSVGTNGKSIALKGLPLFYQLAVGDYVSFVYSTTLVALHQVLEAATAGGTGDTAEFEVTPFIRTGAAADNVVTLIKPYGLFRIVPGSYAPPTSGGPTSGGGGFKMIQVLK